MERFVGPFIGFFIWYFLIVPVLGVENVTVQRVAAAAAYPLADVGLIFVVLIVLMRGVSSSVRRTMRLLVAATFCWIVADTTVSYRSIDPTKPVTVGWEIFLHLTVHFLLCAATFEQVRKASAGWDIAKVTARLTQVSRLPYAAIAAAFVLLTLAASRPSFAVPWLGLIFCMAVLTACVVSRQVLAQQANLRMASTDVLTGLTNRAGLYEALSITLARGARSGHTSAVLLADLDGFKQVNDTLGHDAGDKLLMAFGAALRRSVLGRDVVGRLGGDEFVVILNNVGSMANAGAVIRRLHAELEAPADVGEALIQIRSSVGVALCGPGELNADQLLRAADQNMYEIKRARRAEQTA